MGVTTPPTTWSQFAADALKVHQANPKVFFGDFAAGDGQWVLSLMQQAGAWPFEWNGGSKVTIDFTGKAQMAFANYWQKLVSEGAIDHANDPFTSTSPFFEGLERRDVLDVAHLGVGPLVLRQLRHQQVSGPLDPGPRCPAAPRLVGQLGRLDVPRLQESQHPAQAAEFAEWLAASPQAWNDGGDFAVVAVPDVQARTGRPGDEELDHPHVEERDGPVRRTRPSQRQRSRPLRWPPFMTYYLEQHHGLGGQVLRRQADAAAVLPAPADQHGQLCEAAGLPGQHLDACPGRLTPSRAGRLAKR